MANLQQKKSELPSDENLKALLRPINKKSAVGPYIRYDELFDKIVTARTQEDTTLPQGIWKRDLKQADWPQVVSLCEDFISHHSKDLQIAAWLTQALYHTKGLKGLGQGLFLFNKLCITYWANIHPCSPDKEETQEERSNLTDWINEKLSFDLHRVPITKPESTKLTAFTFGEASRLESNPSQTANSGETTSYQQSQKETPTSFYQKLVADTTATLDELKHLEYTLENNLGENIFSLTQLRNTLQSIQAHAQTRCDARAAKPQKLNKIMVKVKDKILTKKPPKVSEKPIQAHQETKANDCKLLYQQLEKIAGEMKKNHPHSPAPYLIQKAISTDQRSLQEWWSDIESYNLEALSLQKWLGILPPKN